jgi:hypothetical protein
MMIMKIRPTMTPMIGERIRARTTALATDDAFAGKKKEYNQATSQANACGNGELPLNVFCQNIGSQVQGDENAVAATGSQSAD